MDATLKTLQKFDDPSQWDYVEENVPIFVEHSLWEIPHPFDPKSKIKVAILPGQEKPKDGTLLYSITEEDLKSTAAKINAALSTSGNAVKIFIGHSDASKPQKDNPEIVGYGVGAKFGAFGPKGIKAVLASKLCYLKGKYDEAKTFPERSPEYKPLTGQITGLALLRTDPKLPMGHVSYHKGTEEIFCYGPEFIKDKEGEERDEGVKPAEGADKPSSRTGEADGPKALPVDPTEPPTVDELDPEHKDLAEKYMSHYKRNDPLMRYMCTRYEADANAASAPPAPAIQAPEEAGGAKPPVPSEPPKKEEKPAAPKEGTENMSDPLATVDHAQLLEMQKNLATLMTKVDVLASANTTLTSKYAESEAKRIKEGLLAEGYVIKNPDKLVERLKLTDDAGRKGIVQDVRENYAQDTKRRRDPSELPDIETYAEGVEGGQPEIEISEMDMTAAVKYAEQHKLNLDNDDDYAKVANAIALKNGQAIKGSSKAA